MVNYILGKPRTFLFLYYVYILSFIGFAKFYFKDFAAIALFKR